jgi:alkylation response protein AidB-like acyl-CoA dehydrogenase
MQLTHEHEQIRDTLRRYIDEHINPHVDAWEEAEIFPAQVFKGLGDLGLLGLTKPRVWRHGLDYSYSMVMAETLGHIAAAACPWPSACRPTCARRRWRALAATPCASFWPRPSRATWWAASA